MEKKAKDIESIFEFCRNLNHREDIRKYVEEPLIEVCEYLYDLNILTTMSSANLKHGNDRAYIVLDYETLSDYNKKVLQDAINERPFNFRISKFSILHANEEIEISMPIDDETEIQDIKNFFMDIFKGFKIQDIDSFIDGETYMKNIYTFNELVALYLKIKRCPYDDSKKVEFSAEIDNFFKSIGIKKIPAKDYGSGVKADFCDFIYRYHSMLTFEDSEIYESLLKNKDKLFNSDAILRENINRRELLEGINSITQRKYGETFFFNQEDGRFYLNQELLQKHKNYVKERDREEFR